MFDTSEPKDFQEPGQELNIRVASLFSSLPRPSDLEGKRKIMANPPCGKRRSRRVGLKTVKHEKRVKEHPNEPLTVSNGSKLFLSWHTGIMGTFFSIIGIFLES